MSPGWGGGHTPELRTPTSSLPFPRSSYKFLWWENEQWPVGYPLRAPTSFLNCLQRESGTKWLLVNFYQPRKGRRPQSKENVTWSPQLWYLPRCSMWNTFTCGRKACLSRTLSMPDYQAEGSWLNLPNYLPLQCSGSKLQALGNVRCSCGFPTLDFNLERVIGLSFRVLI